MVSDTRVDGHGAEDFSEHVEDAIHDGAVAGFRGFPDSVIDHVSGVVNHVNSRMCASHSADGVLNGFPRVAAILSSGLVK